MRKEHWDSGKRTLLKIPKRGRGWNHHLTPKELRESRKRVSERLPAIMPDLTDIAVPLSEKSKSLELKNNPPKLK